MLGISLDELTEEKAKAIGIKQVKGVLVVNPLPNSAAAEAGLRQNDIITKVNDAAVNSVAQLQEQLSKFRPNDQISLSVNRSNKPLYFNVVLRNKDGNTRIITKKDASASSMLGAVFSAPNPNLMRQLRIPNGVQVAELRDGILKEQGVKKGYIIVHINRVAVASVQDIDRILQQVQSDVVLMEGIYPNGMRAYYAFPVQ